jgi:hypothetical protein
MLVVRRMTEVQTAVVQNRGSPQQLAFFGSPIVQNYLSLVKEIERKCCGSFALF